MALPTSGQITLNQMHTEVGGTSGTQASLNDSDIRGLISKGSGAQMAFNEWYGASAGVGNAVTGTLVYAGPPIGDKYSTNTWDMTTFTDNVVNGKSIKRIHISTSTIISAGLIDIYGSHTAGTNARASQVLGYNYMKLGSTQVLDLTSGIGGTYNAAGNFTTYNLITWSTGSLTSSTSGTKTFTFTA